MKLTSYGGMKKIITSIIVRLYAHVIISYETGLSYHSHSKPAQAINPSHTWYSHIDISQDALTTTHLKFMY